MRLKIEAPKHDPKVSLEVEVDEEKVKQGIARLYYFLRHKLPIGVKIENGQKQSQYKN